jgi:hypothetical protein
VRRVSLSGVAPGTIVDYSITTEELKPFLPRDFFLSWSVSTGLQVARSRYVVDLPVGLTPRIEERNLSFKRDERVNGGRRVFTWATANVSRVKSEPLAADSNDVYMSILVSSLIAWADIARWYAALARHIEGTTGVQPKEALPDLITWLREVGKNDAKLIVLTREAR